MTDDDLKAAGFRLEVGPQLLKAGMPRRPVWHRQYGPKPTWFQGEWPGTGHPADRSMIVRIMPTEARARLTVLPPDDGGESTGGGIPYLPTDDIPAILWRLTDNLNRAADEARRRIKEAA